MDNCREDTNNRLPNPKKNQTRNKKRKETHLVLLITFSNILGPTDLTCRCTLGFSGDEPGVVDPLATGVIGGAESGVGVLGGAESV
jgi:hypothetical protein